jgi:ABC-type oligopeptide transport system ATPase subunit
MTSPDPHPHPQPDPQPQLAHVAADGEVKAGPGPVLVVDGLVKRFRLRRTARQRANRVPAPFHTAVDNVSFTVGRGEILGLAGGSGSGKTTTARCIIRLVEPDEGTIRFDGVDVRAAEGKDLRELRRRMPMVFQDPYSSLNPRIKVGAAILEAGRVHHRPGSENGTRFVADLLERVQLSSRLAGRFPRDLSGGQRQRVAIARSLAVGPELLIADEAVSALDVSIQVQLLNLFLELREDLGVSILFVAHQLAVIAEVADRVAIMHQGQIVESGTTREVFHAPKHAYTQALLAANPDPRRIIARS